MKTLILSTLLFCTFSAYSSPDTTAKAKCSGTTQKGAHCSNNAANNTTFCRFHNPNTVKCAGTTKSGDKCNSLPSKGSTFCFRHLVK